MDKFQKDIGEYYYTKVTRDKDEKEDKAAKEASKMVASAKK
jgi:hypothetical protein